MPDLHYEAPELAELYDLDSGWSVDRDYYLALAGPKPIRILDLGCGTGLLCDAYANLGHQVTGVDPAKAMLDVARRKPNGSKIEWVQASAQSLDLGRKFDLIIMTGNAFQVLLEDDDILKTFATMRKHLTPNGIAAFESRNPSLDWAARWNRDFELDLNGRIRVSCRAVRAGDNRVAFDTQYALPGKTLVSSSELLFLSAAEIEQRLGKCGLKVEALYGDWAYQPFDPAASEEMAFIVRAL